MIDTKVLELQELKNELEDRGYNRHLAYRVTYFKDNEEKSNYFDDKEDANLFVSALQGVNQKAPNTYRCIVLNRWSWELYVEP